MTFTEHIQEVLRTHRPRPSYVEAARIAANRIARARAAHAAAIRIRHEREEARQRALEKRFGS